jgi:hypothetical protein
MAESNLQLDQANSVFGRVEYVRKSGEEFLLSPPLEDGEFNIGALSLGYIREFARIRGATLGVGMRGAINLIPRALEDVYGSRTPAGLAVFLRVRPNLFAEPHAMDAELHHNH